MLSIQECVNKTEKQRQKVEDFMDSKGYFDAEECNIYEGLKRSIQRELSETLHKLSLKELLFGPGTLSTGTLGAAGVHYLVPTWLSQKLYAASALTDIVPLISADVFEPRGGDCIVPVGVVSAHLVGEGEIPTDAYVGKGPTIKLQKIVVPSVCTNEMIEDNQYGLVEWHIQQAGEAMGRRGSDAALGVMAVAGTTNEGYGTVATETGAADETLPEDILNVFDAIGVGDPKIQPVANTMVITPEAWSHSVAADTTAAYFPTGINPGSPAAGFDLKFYCFDTKFSGCADLATGGAGVAMTKCKTLVFDRNVALVTARKNWLRVENYSDPVKDLGGAVVSGRQDSVMVVDEALGIVTEA